MQPRIEPESIAVQLWRRRFWILPGLLIALVAAIDTGHRIQLSPPSLERDSAEFAAASTQVLVDFPLTSSMLEIQRPLNILVERANVYARVAASPAIVELVARRAGLEPEQIDAKGPFNPNTPRSLREPTAERRANQLRAERGVYRLRFDAEEDQGVPIVNIYSQAPTAKEANRLADAGAFGLRAYVKGIQREQDVPAKHSVRIRQLGHAAGGIVNPGVDRQIAVLTFMGAFVGWSMLVLLGGALLRFVRNRGLVPPPPPGTASVIDMSPQEEPDLRAALERR
jgi:hypothetical protein